MKAFKQLQKIGKALMTPVAILPAAGLLLAFGTTLGIPLMSDAGGVIFSNLALLFAVGSAIGLAGGAGVAGLASIVSILIMNTVMGIITKAGEIIPLANQAKNALATEMSSKGLQQIIDSYSNLGDRWASQVANLPVNDAIHHIANQGLKYTEVLGIPTIQTGVFGGLVAGIIAAIMYNKFYKIELPDFLGFFAGKRFVPIVTALVSFIIGLILPTIWSPIQVGLFKLSYLANETNTNVTTFVFGVIERALIPFGLHHIFYSPFWFEFGEYVNKAGEVVRGDQAIWFAMLKDGVANFSSATYQGAGKFMTGKFPFMMFGLPAAALAMYHEAKPAKKKIVGGILFSAALTSFLTGITEPIEFSFLFVAPVLYGIHVLFAGLSFMLMNMLGVRIGMTFSGGLIDFISFGVLQGMTPWYLVIVVGALLAVIYYFGFRFVIRKWNLATPGREDDVEVSEDVSGSNRAESILAALGGAENVEEIDACITRLRVSTVDPSKVDDDRLKQIGASGVMKPGGGAVQAIFGPKSETIKDEIKKLL